MHEVSITAILLLMLTGRRISDRAHQRRSPVLWYWNSRWLPFWYSLCYGNRALSIADYSNNFFYDIMKREELLPLALKHSFGHCEVGTRLIGLVAEIEQIAMDKAHHQYAADISTLEQENRQLRARIERLTDCAGAHHATS